MFLCVIYFLFVSFFFSFFGGRFLGVLGVFTVVGISFFSGWVCCLVSVLDIALKEESVNLYLFQWFSFLDLSIGFDFFFDLLSSMMVFIVMTVAFCTILFSFDYLLEDPHIVRFVSLISVFSLFMFLLVLSDNLVLFFLGWEGIGVCSFLLISFWFTRVRAVKSAMLAFFINKFSDLFLFVGICFLFVFYGSFNFVFLSTQSLVFFNLFCSTFIYNVCSLLLIVGAVGKSAQIGLHLWLPEAMEGPTPVSSLIHAATMVTAGIFLLLKLSFFFLFSFSSFLFLLFFGSATTILGATIGISHYDLKKIIAYSTCSQLGYMFLVSGIGGVSLSFFHLFNHAFFKALLFLTSGYIIHAFGNEQDIRSISNGMFFLPFAFVMFLFASLSMMGLPFFSGAYSKESIISLFLRLDLLLDFESAWVAVFFFQMCALFTIFFTLLYSIEVLFFVFFRSYDGSISLYRSFGHNVTYFTLFSLSFLFFCSLFSGFLFNDFFVDYIDSFLCLVNSHLHELLFRSNSLQFYTFVVVFDFLHYLHFFTLMLIFYFVAFQFFFFYFFHFFYIRIVFYIYGLEQFLFYRFFYFSFFHSDIYSFLSFSRYSIYFLLDKKFLDFEVLWSIFLKSLSFLFSGCYSGELNQLKFLVLFLLGLTLLLVTFSLFFIF